MTEHKCNACGNTQYELLEKNNELGFFDARCVACHTVIRFKKIPIRVTSMNTIYPIIHIPSFKFLKDGVV